MNGGRRGKRGKKERMEEKGGKREKKNELVLFLYCVVAGNGMEGLNGGSWKSVVIYCGMVRKMKLMVMKHNSTGR